MGWVRRDPFESVSFNGKSSWAFIYGVVTENKRKVETYSRHHHHHQSPYFYRSIENFVTGTCYMVWSVMISLILIPYLESYHTGLMWSPLNLVMWFMKASTSPSSAPLIGETILGKQLIVISSHSDSSSVTTNPWNLLIREAFSWKNNFNCVCIWYKARTGKLRLGYEHNGIA